MFDRLHELGKDNWLLEIRQTPKPIQLNEQGMSWNQVVASRLALLNASPAIKAKSNNVVGDPIQANGLPTSAVTDMGNHFRIQIGLGSPSEAFKFTVSDPVSINGNPAWLIGYTVPSGNPTINLAAMILRGNRVHHVEGFSVLSRADANEATLTQVLGSYKALR